VNALSSASQYRFEQQYVIVRADSLTGTFANGAAMADVASDPMLKWRLRYDLVANAVVLQVQKAMDFTPTGADSTPNQSAVGGALNGAAGNASDQWAATLNAISALSPAERSAAYDSLSGEAIASAGTA